ncbi:FHA domain-containing protein FhaB/FipA [Cryptosporangium aurantiacum]|uniref:Inner membrane component of T3SS domain-containing protein n=1 Tax=Cryptosporangium aurantiacum TaxID=134849 RepID=A0A1M7RKW8_9ACTN|nr:FHA domain-containing protein [Cryptosporangium aurantiacum]SHN46796.1 Inner membrane component of T3SS domain-containing protein [Cryptosporangium aurantiacum]
MPEVVLAVARFGFLALLWVFVFAVVGVIRRDLTGARQPRLVATPRGVPLAPPGRPAKVKRGRGDAGVPRTLVVTEGALTGTRITLSDLPITLGRADDSTLVLNDDYASAQHARLVPRAGEWLIEDLGSTNGTYLGQTKISGPTPVPLGAPIRIGRTSIELRS